MEFVQDENIWLQYLQRTWQPPPANGADPYCFRCGKSGLSLVKCVSCPRSYHVNCTVNIDSRCYECVAIRLVAKRSKGNLQPYQQANLKNLFNKLKLDFEKSKFQAPISSTLLHKYIVMPMTVDNIGAKVNLNEYANSREFLADVQWLRHNIQIFCLAGDVQNLQRFEAMFECCQDEVTAELDCSECYHNSYTRPRDWFELVCAQTHTLVWAKFEDYPYWPAKVCRVNDQEHISVQFFGHHERASIPASNCYLLSVESPNDWGNKQRPRTWRMSISECDRHIQNIVEERGAFEYALDSTPYVPPPPPTESNEEEKCRIFQLLYKSLQPFSNVYVVDYLI